MACSGVEGVTLSDIFKMSDKEVVGPGKTRRKVERNRGGIAMTRDDLHPQSLTAEQFKSEWKSVGRKVEEGKL